MSILTPGFSERVFEFSFNAEYAHRNRAVLAGAPHIPTQNQEKALGYDVKMRIEDRGGATHAIALQHKVSRYVDAKGPTNSKYYDAAGGAYFGFRLDVPQFNLIQKLATSALPGFSIYFCAPLFASLLDLDRHYLATEVERHSVWIDVSSSAPLGEDEPHSIIYTPDGSRAFVFSEEGKKLEIQTATDRLALSRERRVRGLLEPNRRLDDEKLYADLLEVVRAFVVEHAARVRAARRRSNRQRSTIQQPQTFRVPLQVPQHEEEVDLRAAAMLLSKYAGLSLLIETPAESDSAL